MLPEFEYNPNCMQNGTFEKSKNGEVCECCGKITEYHYPARMYCRENVDCLCPSCISDGSAAKKFNGTFIQDAEEVSDPAKTEKLFKRTPGLITWQGEQWLACCDDYCAFIDYVGIEELDKMGITEEVLAEYAEHDEYDVDMMRDCLEREGSVVGYLFRCLHCRKYRIWADAD